MTAADPAPKLTRGLTLAAVRRLLPNWQGEPIVAKFSDDKRSYITIWDFIPPPGLDTHPLRLTFINYELDHWGRPSRDGTTLFV